MTEETPIMKRRTIGALGALTAGIIGLAFTTPAFAFTPDGSVPWNVPNTVCVQTSNSTNEAEAQAGVKCQTVPVLSWGAVQDAPAVNEYGGFSDNREITTVRPIGGWTSGVNSENHPYDMSWFIEPKVETMPFYGEISDVSFPGATITSIVGLADTTTATASDVTGATINSVVPAGSSFVPTWEVGDNGVISYAVPSPTWTETTSFRSAPTAPRVTRFGYDYTLYVTFDVPNLDGTGQPTGEHRTVTNGFAFHATTPQMWDIDGLVEECTFDENEVGGSSVCARATGYGLTAVYEGVAPNAVDEGETTDPEPQPEPEEPVVVPEPEQPVVPAPQPEQPVVPAPAPVAPTPEKPRPHITTGDAEQSALPGWLFAGSGLVVLGGVVLALTGRRDPESE